MIVRETVQKRREWVLCWVDKEWYQSEDTDDGLVYYAESTDTIDEPGPDAVVIEATDADIVGLIPLLQDAGVISYMSAAERVLRVELTQ